MKDLTNQDLEMIKDLLENREKYKIIEKTSNAGNFKSNLAKIVIPFRDKYNIENDGYAIELSRCNKDILTCLRDLKKHSNPLTTKEKLEQLGWEIRHNDETINFTHMDANISLIYFINGGDINIPTWLFDEDTNAMLDYIKEQEK